MAGNISKIFSRSFGFSLKKIPVRNGAGLLQESRLLTPAAVSLLDSKMSYAKMRKIPLRRDKLEYYFSDSDDETWRRKGRRGTGEFWRRKMQTFHRLLDFNNDGVISYDDYKLFADRFISLGHISEKSAKEFRDLVKRTWEAQWGEITPYNLVTLEQYLEDMRHVVNDPDRARRAGDFLPYLFEAIDRDGSGRISLAEFRAFFGCLGHTDEDAAFTFRLIDRDCDGAVDRGEFLRYGRDFFVAEDEARVSKHFWGPLVES